MTAHVPHLDNPVIDDPERETSMHRSSPTASPHAGAAACRLPRAAVPAWCEPRRVLRTSAAGTVAGVLLVAASGGALADGTPPVASTVRATVSDNGMPTAVKLLKPDGRGGVQSTDVTDPLPLTMTTTPTVGGQPGDIGAASGPVSLAFHVENTSGKTREVSYTASDGSTKKTTTLVTLPLVGQLRVALPKGYTSVQAPGAQVRVDPDGTTRLLWSLVLFTPLGSPAADLAFTANGAKSGAPAVDLQAATIDPGSTPGLSVATTDANATQTQSEFLKTYAQAGNSGLTQLKTGLGQIVAGLTSAHSGAQQLSTGLGAAVSGANQLAAGTRSARNGSGSLSAGLTKINTGAGQLAAGTGQLKAGTKPLAAGAQQIAAGNKQIAAGNKSLAAGTGKLSTGATSLATGVGQIAVGNSQLAAGFAGSATSPGLISGSRQLTSGLQQVDAGLGQLAAVGGLPAAAGGAKALKAGVDAVVAGIGPEGTTNAATLLGGLAAAADGVQKIRDGVTGEVGGVSCVKAAVAAVRFGSVGSPIPAGCPNAAAGNGATPTGESDPGKQAVLERILAGIGSSNSFDSNTVLGGLDLIGAGLSHTNPLGLKEGLSQITAGLNQIRQGLSHPVGAAAASDPGGIDEGLASLVTGLDSAVSGVTQLKGGTAQLATGSGALSAGIGQAGTGAQSLASGSGQAAVGSVQLRDGLKSANAGAHKLAAGSASAATGAGKLAVGAGQLDAGAGKLAAGTRQLAAGTTSAASGSNQLTAGLVKLSAGQDQVAAGLPAAVTGSGQLSAGLQQLLTGSSQAETGIGSVQTGAAVPLATQLVQSSDNARQTLAVLQATTARATADPLGSQVTYDLALSSNPAGLTNAAFSQGSVRTVDLLGVMVLLVAGGSVPFLVRRRLARRGRVVQVESTP